jgi:TonB-dependent receptor
VAAKGLLLASVPIPYSSASAQAADSAAPAQELSDPAEQGTAASEEIIVTGQRASQQRAIELKRQAIGVLDVAAADEIGRLPDRNVAEVVERLPGVGVTYDQGEGRYVSIRGIPAELNNYTVNGFELGNPDGNTRALPLDVVSGQLLNRVEVVKAKTADLDAQGIGGSINLVTQTAFDFRNPFTVQVSGQIGHQELNDANPVRGEASIAGRFGADEEFGILVGVSYSDRTFVSYGVFPDDWRPIPAAARGGLPINIKYSDYNLHRERIGATTSFDWRPGENHQFYFRGLYSKFKEDEYRQRYRLDFATSGIVDAGGLVLNPDGLTGTATVTERRQDLRLEEKDKSILAMMAGGQSGIGIWQLDYALARIHNEVHEPNQLWQFRGNPGIVDFDFTDRLFTAVPRTELAPAGLQFRQYSEQDENGEEDIWTGRIDVKRELGGGSENFIKFGAKYRTANKQFDAENTVWGRGSAANRFTLGQFDLAGDPVIIRAGRAYSSSPTIDADAIRNFTADNLGSSRFVLDEGSTLANAVLGDFDIDEDIAAAYAMANVRFGIATLTAGLRVERTKLDISGFALANETQVTPARGSSEYTSWLPSIIARIAPAEDVIMRLAYTRAIGRPQYSQLTPGAELGFEDNGDGTFDGELSLGNPQLKPYVSDGLDATFEYYFARGSLLSVGAFAKFVKNPIFGQSVVQNDVTYNAREFLRLETSQPQNADSGRITGLELAYQQQFTFLPGLLSGFGAELNLAFINSELKVPGRAEDSTFPNQSDLIYSAQLFYQRGRVEASIAYHHTGRSLLLLGDEPLNDQYSDDFRRLDAKASFAITEGINLFFEAQNLTDEPTRQYQGGHRDWMIQNERYGRTYYVGASAKW